MDRTTLGSRPRSSSVASQAWPSSVTDSIAPRAVTSSRPAGRLVQPADEAAVVGQVAVAVEVGAGELQLVEDVLPVSFVARWLPAEEATRPQHGGRVDGRDRGDVVRDARAQDAVQAAAHGGEVGALGCQHPDALAQVHGFQHDHADPPGQPLISGIGGWPGGFVPSRP
ncbi:hypothetical protein [Frankia sp. EAN1pec]|uniref:hypothetical protein n=1 Tax=Parafrankia sp. (strain EAN1pec) TaxID=298653 RepID=UPI0012F771F2